MLYLIVNESKAPELTPDVLEQMRADMQSAYDTIFAPAWNTNAAEIRIGADSSAQARVLHFVDDIPEAPGALAYHTVDDQGRPTLRLGVETIRGQGGVLLDEISKAASHEIFETAVNPFVSYYAFVPHHDAMLALEVCDPVQSTYFEHGKTAISNFVLPSYFDVLDLAGPFDYVAELIASFACTSGGYQAWSDGTQSFGAAVSEKKQIAVSRFGRVVRAQARKAAA